MGGECLLGLKPMGSDGGLKFALEVRWWSWSFRVAPSAWQLSQVGADCGSVLPQISILGGNRRIVMWSPSFFFRNASVARA
jgi:hypothetical protein